MNKLFKVLAWLSDPYPGRLQRAVDDLSKTLLASDDFPIDHMTCPETDAFLRLLVLGGHSDIAIGLLFRHGQEDKESGLTGHPLDHCNGDAVEEYAELWAHLVRLGRL